MRYRLQLALAMTLDWIDDNVFRHCFHRFGLCTFINNLWPDDPTGEKKDVPDMPGP